MPNSRSVHLSSLHWHKAKWIDMVLPIIKYILLHNIRSFYVLKDIKIASVVQTVWPFCWILRKYGFHIQLLTMFIIQISKLLQILGGQNILWFRVYTSMV